MAFTLETVSLGSRPELVIVSGGLRVPLAKAAARFGVALGAASLFDLLATWDEAWPVIAGVAERIAEATDLALGADAEQGPAIQQLARARKVICAGANYYKHLAEMNVTLVKDASKAPFFFMKPPNALVGPGRTIPVDPSIRMLDWEVELAAVIGRSGRDIPVSRALDHVAGYTIAVDVTARDRLFQPESIFKFDFFAGKGQDGFCPTAAAFLPAAFLRDPQDTGLRLAVNGVMKQDARTSDMIYSVAELVSWASRLTTLEPGDVLLTGSPEGVGFPRGESLKIGDVMRVELDTLGGFDVEVYEKPRGEVRS